MEQTTSESTNEKSSNENMNCCEENESQQTVNTEDQNNVEKNCRLHEENETATESVKDYCQVTNGSTTTATANENSEECYQMKNIDEDDAVVQVKTLKSSESNPYDILYGVDDTPPWHLCSFLAFQHYLMMLSTLISIPYLLAPAMCISDDDPARGHMISTIMFVAGLATLLQTTFGTRLPIVQGGTLALVIPALAVLNHPKWKCGESEDSYLMEQDKDEYWMRRMREIQGGVLLAGLFEMVLGATGLVGILLRFITPLAIAPTIALIGLATFEKAADLASGNWGIAVLTMALLVIFSQYLQNIDVPFPAYRRKLGCTVVRYPLFKVFSVLLTIVIVWIFSAILTSAGVFGSDSLARTDRKMRILNDMPWFRVPYPGQWGMPTVSPGSVLGMMAGVTASIVESIGDYYACARISSVPVPPRHAINRGIGMEGLGCILGGIWGSGNGTTSYSQNIAAIGITRVASRRVVQVCAVFMIVFGIFGKFGALFVTIPEPIVGGVFCILFGMVAAVGLSNLQFVNLESSRNMFILGFSLFLGLAIPKWIESHEDAIHTGSMMFDQIVTILLSTPMFVGGCLGVILDNTIPGTAEERGLHHDGTGVGGAPADVSSYDFPYGMNWVRKSKVMRHIPVSPTYQPGVSLLCGKKRRTTTMDECPADDAMEPLHDKTINGKTGVVV